MGRITRTVEGNLVTFRSPGEVPITSAKVSFIPKQEGSGTPSPTNNRSIIGATGITLTRTGKNILNPARCTVSQNPYVSSGITFTRNNDGTVTVNGTTTGTGDPQIGFLQTMPFTENYYFSSGLLMSSGTANVYYWNVAGSKRLTKWDGTTNSGTSSVNANLQEVQLPAGVDARYTCRVQHGATVNNAVFYPMLLPKNCKDTTYEQYNGITYTASWESSLGTVFGGSYDFVSGKLSMEWARMSFSGGSSENWNVETVSNGGANFYISTPSILKRDTGNNDLYCNIANPSSNLQQGDVRISSTGNLNVYLGPVLGITTVAEFKQWLSSNTLVVVCRLAVPAVLDAGDTNNITSLKGWNNFYADIGSTEVEYPVMETADMMRIRQKIMMSHKEIDGLPVLLDNRAYNTQDNYYDANVYHMNDYFVTGWFDTGDNNAKTYTYFQSVRHNMTSSQWTYVRFYNDKKAQSVDYYSNNGAEIMTRKITTLGGRYIAASVYKPDAYRSWMYDHTNERYVYEGKDARTGSARILQTGKRYGGGNPASTSLQTYENGCITRIYLFPKGTSGKRTLVLQGGCGSQIEYKNNGTTYYDWWTFESLAKPTSRDIVSAESDGFAFSLDTRYIDDAYAYIAESGFIIFAGKNSIYYGHNNISEVT